MWSYPRSYERNFSNCVEKPEKFRTSTVFVSVTRRCRCSTLTNQAMKPLMVGAGYLWVHHQWLHSSVDKSVAPASRLHRFKSCWRPEFFRPLFAIAEIAFTNAKIEASFEASQRHKKSPTFFALWLYLNYTFIRRHHCKINWFKNLTGKKQISHGWLLDLDLSFPKIIIIIIIRGDIADLELFSQHSGSFLGNLPSLYSRNAVLKSDSLYNNKSVTKCHRIWWGWWWLIVGNISSSVYLKYAQLN